MNEKNLDKLIEAASRKLGTSPEKLKSTLESGDMQSLSSGLTKADKAKLRAVLANEELMRKLKNASDPQEMMRVLKDS